MTQNTQIHSSSVFLVSGGGRGVTAQCVIKLAERYQCKFILLGRSSITEPEPVWARGCFDEPELKRRIVQDLVTRGEKPTPIKVQRTFNAILAKREIARTLQAIQQAGGQAEYLSVDVTDSPTLQVKLTPVVQRLGPITGVIHGAGNLADKLIENKSEQDFETVYAAKVEGLESLLSCVRPSQLDFIVLFSSFVAFYGNAGQSDYALANEIINKFAYLLKRQYPSCHVVSIGWGPWDGGMVNPQLKKLFAQRNIELIPIEVGAQMLIDELKPSNQENVQVLVMNSPLVPLPKTLNPELKEIRLYRKLTLADNPFLYDHVIGGHPVLPAMCGLSWIANVCEQMYPGYRFFSCKEIKVLKGIVFAETLAKEYTLDLKEISKFNSGEIDFEALLWSNNEKGKPVYHYSVQIRLLQQSPQAPIYESFVSSQDQTLLSLSPYQNGVLFHRCIFQGVKRILNISSEKLTAHCILGNIEAKTQGQFPVQSFNPYTADLMLQCMAIWIRHFYGLASLPLQVQNLEQFKSIPFEQDFYISVEVPSRSKTNMIASATAHDIQGQVYTRISQMQLTASESLNPLFFKNECAVAVN